MLLRLRQFFICGLQGVEERKLWGWITKKRKDQLEQGWDNGMYFQMGDFQSYNTYLNKQDDGYICRWI